MPILFHTAWSASGKSLADMQSDFCITVASHVLHRLAISSAKLDLERRLHSNSAS